MNNNLSDKNNHISFEFAGGAGGEVTGSALGISIPADGKGRATNLLLDYGAFMGGDRVAKYIENKRPIHEVFTIFKDGRDIDDLFISHSHNDHQGRGTGLIRDGFYGRIFCTEESKPISALMFRDAKKIEELTFRQLGDSIIEKVRREYKETLNDRGKGDRPKIKQKSRRQDQQMLRFIKPRTDAEIEKTIQLMSTCPVDGDWRKIRENVDFRLLNAGHILGSTMTQIRASFDDNLFGILDTHDLGNPDKESYLGQPNFEGIDGEIDLAFIESTYGNTERSERQPALEKMLTNIISTLQNGGKVLIPAFALERTQEILAFIGENLERINGKVGMKVPVYLDSKLAQDVTDLYRKLLRAKNTKVPFEKMIQYENFHRITSNDRTSSIYGEGNKKAGIIVASSGMCDAGPVREHLKRLIEDPENLIQFIGFPGNGTLASRIQKAPRNRGTVNIEREPYSVRARVENCGQFSSHPDAPALVNMVEKIPFRDLHKSRLVIKHGSEAAASGLKERILNAIDFDPKNILIPECDRNNPVIYHVPVSVVNT